jgi:hypothetical protein
LKVTSFSPQSLNLSPLFLPPISHYINIYLSLSQTRPPMAKSWSQAPQLTKQLKGMLPLYYVIVYLFIGYKEWIEKAQQIKQQPFDSNSCWRVIMKLICQISRELFACSLQHLHRYIIEQNRGKINFNILDTELERNYLMKKIYTYLKSLC